MKSGAEHMNDNHGDCFSSRWITGIVIVMALHTAYADYPTISPSPYWKNDVAFPYDAFCDRGISKESAKWIKFSILLEPYDPNVVYFQNCSKDEFAFHYSFATQLLDPFIGMTTQQFNAATLYKEGQKAILGTVILPPAAVWPTQPRFREYGIQLIRQDPFTREEIRDLFNLVKAHVAAPADVQAFYLPTYEQQKTASANRDWFESEGIPLGSMARWTEGNACYSQGWAFGRLNYVPAENIASAYHDGTLKPTDILLTDGVPAEVPFVAGILSLAPSTPNSHVAILAQTYVVPFVYLALTADAERVQQLVGHRIAFSAYEDDYGVDVWVLDTDDLLDDAAAARLLQLKNPTAMDISPMGSLGTFGVSTEGLQASDIQYVGGKAANFAILRAAVPDNSPKAAALTFDLWNAFLDQPLATGSAIALMPREHMLFWADGNAEQGPTHTNFRLSKDGETVSLFDADGVTLLDSVQFGPQTKDVSYGRSLDGGDSWQTFSSPTPGQSNSALAGEDTRGLVINELMADNKQTIEDPAAAGRYPDWIELYNASDVTITLNGLYLTDDANEPTRWQIPPEVVGPTLRQEIVRRLSKYTTYPPADMRMLSQDMAAIRGLFTNASLTDFTKELQNAVIDVLSDPAYGFDPSAPLRFRSSTNVEDSVDFIGAGLYDSFSGSLPDAADDDPNRQSQRDVFQAIRQVFASFYNDNAYLERLRRGLDESKVGMGVVVHHSFPDEIELANGVAKLQRDGEESNISVSLVSQQGSVSVTNPEDGSTPEEITVTILPSGSTVPPKLVAASSLVRLGDTVMSWSDDYTALT
ncbi:MAG: PEP/pyruvate-binding domain-containing protein, partial [Solirubrobacterales bacterium]